MGSERASAVVPKGILRRLLSYHFVARLVGSVLLAAALLKSFGLFTNPPVPRGLFTQPWFLLAVAECELFLGLWLWSGFYPTWSWRAGLGTFFCFFAVALYQALAGERSCACFGPLSVAPWIMVIIDAAAVLLLSLTELPPQPVPTRATHPRRFATVVAIWLLVGTGGVTAFLLKPAATELLSVSNSNLDLGEVQQASDHTVSFSVRNPGSAPVTVAQIHCTCPCMTFNIDPATVPPGGESRIVAQLDLNREPDYTGRLAIDVQGRTQNNQIAFRMVITVRVTAPPQLP